MGLEYKFRGLGWCAVRCAQLRTLSPPPSLPLLSPWPSGAVGRPNSKLSSALCGVQNEMGHLGIISFGFGRHASGGAHLLSPLAHLFAGWPAGWGSAPRSPRAPAPPRAPRPLAVVSTCARRSWALPPPLSSAKVCVTPHLQTLSIILCEHTTLPWAALTLVLTPHTTHRTHYTTHTLHTQHHCSRSCKLRLTLTSPSRAHTDTSTAHADTTYSSR